MKVLCFSFSDMMVNWIFGGFDLFGQNRHYFPVTSCHFNSSTVVLSSSIRSTVTWSLPAPHFPHQLSPYKAHLENLLGLSLHVQPSYSTCQLSVTICLPLWVLLPTCLPPCFVWVLFWGTALYSCIYILCCYLLLLHLHFRSKYCTSFFTPIHLFDSYNFFEDHNFANKQYDQLMMLQYSTLYKVIKTSFTSPSNDI